MLTKEVVTGLITILQDGQIQVREDTVVIEDGKELSRTYNRYILMPGDDVSRQSQEIQDITKIVWTPEVIVSWKAQMAERASKLNPGPPPVQ